jgi:glycosyltransferase involved in cell wall biosynthesis
MDSLASIIVPCYNGEKFVDRCFDSILKQKYAHMEVIVVNDGSTDQSEQRVLAWNDRFRNAGIQLVYVSQKNKGLGGAINTGLKHVTGEYLCLLDIDDELLESAVSTRVAFLKSHPDIDVVRSNGWYNRKNGKSLFIYDEKEKRIDDVFSALVGGETNNWAGSYMVRTSALFDFYPDREIYQSRFGQNLQFLMPLTYKKKCGYIDEPQMIYNIQEDSLSKTSDIKKTEKILSDNLAGYRDIRIYLIEKIIKTPNESERYIRIVDIAYYRSLLKLAIDTRDEQLLKATYSNLKELSGVTINERIEYCQYFFPYMVFPLRCIRKIKTAIDTLREAL